MRILFICNELSYRGTPRFLFNCAKIAKTAGHDVRVWALEQGGATKDECIANGIPVFNGIEAISTAVSFRPDIIHIHRAGGVSHRDNALLRHLKTKCDCRIIETNVFGTADLSLRSSIDVHAHISRWDLWRWRRWFRPFHPVGIYLPYCVDTDALRPFPSDFRTKYGIPADAVLIGRLGKTDWREVSCAMIPAMRKVANIWFATVADYSNSPDAIREWPEELQNRIITIPLLKGSKELSAFYSACDATLNFSPIGESFGFVVAEAMSCGTPCIALSKPRNDNAQIEIAAIACGGFPVRDAMSAEKTILKIAAEPPSTEHKAICRHSIIDRYSLNYFSPILLKAYTVLLNSKATGRKLEKQFAAAGFETDINKSEIWKSLENVIGGGPSLTTRITMCLAYSLLNAIRTHKIVLREFPSIVPIDPHFT